jgi:hypothetical protein
VLEPTKEEIEMKLGKLPKKLVLFTLATALLFVGAAFAKGNTDRSADCTKSIAVARATPGGAQSFLPEFIVNWWRKNSKRYPGVCFSQVPSTTAKN